MKSRLLLPDVATLTAEQEDVRRSILTTRGNLDGPFLAWLHSSQFAGKAEQLGAVCRYGVDLSRAEIETLILVAAARFRCNGEWAIHAPLAQQAGVEHTAIAAILSGLRPKFAIRRLQILHDLAVELLTTSRIGANLFSEALEDLGEKRLVEAVGVVGYYALVAMTLNAFELTVEGQSTFFE